MSKAPVRDVVRAHTLDGERGGTQIVHVLTCGHWVANRRLVPAKRLPCIGCWLVELEVVP